MLPRPFRLALLLSAALAAAGSVLAVTPPVPLAELARALSQADAGSRIDFALVALDEMAVAYRGEAERIYHGRQKPGDAAVNARWASGTGAYARQLEHMLDSALLARDVRIHVDATGSVMLVIDGATVVVGGPRVAEPGLLEHGIVQRFCDRHDCAWLVPPARQEAAQASRMEPAPPGVEWSFSDRGGAICRTDDGFEFLFRDLDNLVLKRAACAQVVGELRSIAVRLDTLRGQGVVVDLQRLAIAKLVEGDQHRLTVNAHGAYTRLALPALARTDGLLRAALPWLDARRRDTAGTLRLSNASVTLAGAIRLAAGKD